jgi:tetratricopeptide (TPR) repeat protein
VKVLNETETTSRGWLTVAAIALVAVGAWVMFPRRASDPDRIWQQAEADVKSGQVDQAEAALARLKDIRSPTALDRMLRAQVAMARSRVDAALADLDSVPDDHPIAAQARLSAGQLELRRGRPRAAEAKFRAALKLDPKLVQARRELIYIYGILLCRAELNAEFRALSTMAPLTVDNVWHWCLTRNSAWEARELTAQLEGYIKADPDDRKSRLALAENYRALDRRQDAEKVLEYLGEADPDARALRARLALDVGDDLVAEALLKDGPSDHSDLARLRGKFALARHDGPAAVAHFRAAYKADPDHRDALFGLGQALIMVGEAEAAAPFVAAARDHDAFATLMQRASVRENRSDPALLRALGAASEKIHRLPEARAWYRAAIDLNPLDTEAQKALFRLQDPPAKSTASSD